MSDKIITKELSLNYYKKGDDLARCITKIRGCIDAKKSIDNLIKLLQSDIDVLKEINKMIPEDNDVELGLHDVGLILLPEILGHLELP